MSDQQVKPPVWTAVQAVVMSMATTAGSSAPTQTMVVSSPGPTSAAQATAVTNTQVSTAAPPPAAPVTQSQQVMVTQHAQFTTHSMPQATMSPALTQIVASMAQPITTPVQAGGAATGGALIRTSMPGTVQVIQGHPFLQQQYMQQQYYIQSVHGVQAMQGQPIGQQVNLTAVQGRPASGGHKSPIINASQMGSQATVTLKTVAPSMTTVAATQTKGGQKTMLQQQAVFGKQVIRGTGGQPLVIGQLGVLQNAGGTQTLVAQAQPKSPSVGISQSGGTQVFNSPTQIRFTTQPTFVNSQGQIISGTVTPAMLNQLQLLGPQSQVIGTQPLYLRPAGPMQQQGIVGSVQAMIPTNKPIRQGTDASGTVQMKSTGTQVKTVAPTQIRGVANILPQTARPFATIPGSPTMAKGVQTGQIKQVSRVRALRPTKTTLATVTAAGQPARIAPQQICAPQFISRQQAQLGTARLFTPTTLTRPPTVLVQPKQQIQQQRTISTTPTTPMVTWTNVTTIPAAAVMANTETQTTVARSTVAPSTVAVSPIKAPTPVVIPVKPEVKNDETSSSGADEPMDTEPPVLVETRPLPQMGTALPQTCTDPPKLVSTGLVKSKGGGMVGAGAGPDRSGNSNSNMNSGTDNGPPSLAPIQPLQTLPIQNFNRDRNARVATVIGERQAAIVKPNILTHVIEGFVIQEGTEPFPVQRCSTLSDFIPERSSSQEADSGVEKDTDDSSISSTDSKQKPTKELPKLKCEYCGILASARRFGSSQRFCSRACSKRYNVGCTRRVGLFPTRKRVKLPASIAAVRKHKNLQLKRWKRGQTGRVTTGPIQRNPEASPLTVDNIRAHTHTTQEGTDGEADHEIGISGLGAPSTLSMETATTTSDESERSTTPSGQDESSSPRSPPELERVEMDMDMCNPALIPLRHPAKWTVREVVDFIRNLQGCSIYADEFNRQEIDGQALMLLKEDHLMSTMNVKLGPALKICAKIKSLTEELP